MDQKNFCSLVKPSVTSLRQTQILYLDPIQATLLIFIFEPPIMKPCNNSPVSIAKPCFSLYVNTAYALNGSKNNLY